MNKVKILEAGLPLFTLNAVLFPQARMPLQIFEPRYREMISRCLEQDLAFGVVLIREGEEVGAPATPHEIGTIAQIVDVARLDDGRMNIIVSGITRFKLLEHTTELAYLTGRIRLLPDENVDLSKTARASARTSRLFKDYVTALRTVAESEEADDKESIRLPKDPVVLSYTIASSLPVNLADKQQLLEAPTALARLEREARYLQRELQLLRLVTEKSDQVRDQGSFSLN
ncbi:MAG: LON peptidase substrate-binding domain-containing protein [Chloroflexi bacterium]|nr:LON peptidase substrate-binding domain-containing protein [Chloroflexota bacterium]